MSNIEYGRGEIINGELVVTRIASIPQSIIQNCPFYILRPDHYRPDGTCKCTDPFERHRMRRDGYRVADFRRVGILPPLQRKPKPRPPAPSPTPTDGAP